jgi:hypothetical protein
MLNGSYRISDSLYQKSMLDVSRSSKVIKLNRDSNSSTSRQVNEQEVGNQGGYFLKCTTGGILITQGDVTPTESRNLVQDVKYIFREYGNAASHFGANPEIRDLLYAPYWKPRDSSPCLLPGVSLVSESCGRVPR